MSDPSVPSDPPEPVPSDAPGQGEGTKGDSSGEGLQRRTVRASAATSLLLHVPWFFWSAVLVWSFAASFVDDTWSLLILVLWVLTGVLTIFRPVQDVLARILRLRRPTMEEQRRYDMTFTKVARAAGVDPTRYTLWVEDAEAINGLTTGGTTIATTRWALTTLSPKQLEAVLAHELAHHLGAQAWASLLGVWYALPARAVLWVIRRGVKLATTVQAIGCLLVGLILFALTPVLVMIFIFGVNPSIPVLLLTPFVAPPLLAWFSRLGEKFADRAAADLGYGPDLIQILYGWQSRYDDVRRGTTRRSEVLATQPTVADRIRNLEMYTKAV